MSDAFHVEVRRRGPGVCEVTVAGELDVATAPDLCDALHQALTTYTRTTVDLSCMTFCDCAGLGALLAAARLAKTHGADLRLRAVPSVLARLLDLFHTGGSFTLEPSATRRA